MPRAFTVDFDLMIDHQDTRGLMETGMSVSTQINERCRESMTSQFRDWWANQLSRKIFGVDYYRRDEIRRNVELAPHFQLGNLSSYFHAQYGLMHFTRHVTYCAITYHLNSSDVENIRRLSEELAQRYGCEYSIMEPTTDRNDIFSRMPNRLISRAITFSGSRGLNALWPIWWMIYFDRALEYIENECTPVTLPQGDAVTQMFMEITNSHGYGNQDVAYNSSDSSRFRSLWNLQRHIDPVDWIVTGSGPCTAHNVESSNYADDYRRRRSAVRAAFRAGNVRCLRRSDDSAQESEESEENAETI